MLKWIRWSGLIGFAVFIALALAFWLLATPWLIRSAIESLGSKAAGARVDVADVTMKLAPIGVELSGLTVANANKPMENLVQFDHAVADLEVGPLFLGKTIIRELSVSGLQFNTTRTTSGALPKTASTGSSGGSDKTSAEPTATETIMAELPSADEILSREPLQTDAAGKALAESFDTRKGQLDEAFAKLPDDEKLKAYETEIKALTADNVKSLEDFQQRKQRLEELREQFRADKKAVNTAKDLIGTTRIEITERLTDLKAAPGQDLDMIRSKYQLNAQGAANLSRLLFGNEAGEWAQQALYWYEKLKPYLDRGSDEAEEEKVVRSDGRYIHFPSNDPWPEFLIRSIHMNAITSSGKLLIEGGDITGQQRVIGRPMHFDIRGADMPTISQLNMALVLDHRQRPGKDTLTLEAVDWAMPVTELGIGETRLASSRVQVQGMTQISGDQLQGKLDMQLAETRFEGTGTTLFAKELTSALQTVGEFSIHAKASGALKSPTVELGSDLDKRLNTAFSKRLRERQDALEASLQKRLNGKIDEYAGPYADDLKAINEMDGSLTDRLAKLEDLGKAEVKDFVANKKQELGDKAKDKAADKLKKLL